MSVRIGELALAAGVLTHEQLHAAQKTQQGSGRRLGAVLVELGYVSNRGDLKSLTSDAWRNRTAASIARAVDTYFTTRVAAGGRQGQN